MNGKHRTALVTGASSGIGRELARLLAADGVDLILFARDRAKLQELSDALQAAQNVSVRIEAMDLAARDAPAQLWSKLTDAGVAIDILVNNAGSGLYGAVEEQDARALVDMLQVNVVALTALTRLALPGMRARRWGRVLNVGSVVGYQPGGPRMAVLRETFRRRKHAALQAAAEDDGGRGCARRIRRHEARLDRRDSGTVEQAHRVRGRASAAPHRARSQSLAPGSALVNRTALLRTVRRELGWDRSSGSRLPHPSSAKRREAADPAFHLHKRIPLSRRTRRSTHQSSGRMTIDPGSSATTT
jgi:NAD(P)-dependent dehydrogenase (short-subunit alcohol dehydrogenase family)